MKFRSQKSRELVRAIKHQILSHVEKTACTEDELKNALSISSKNLPLFEQALKGLVKEKTLLKSKGKLTVTPHTSETVQGKVSMHPKGFGFVKTDSSEKDIFIPKPFTLDAIDGDEVEVEIMAKVSAKGPEGKILRILKRARTHLAGTILFPKDDHYQLFNSQLGPDKIILLKKTKKKLKEGDRVIMKVTDWGQEIEGEFSEYLGNISDPSVDIDAACSEFEIERDFPKDVLEEAKKFSPEVDLNSLTDREDFTHLNTITIDPDTAKDFDDALSLTLDEKGNFDLGVHIADVSHYVTSKSHLDYEALKRSNSTYFPGKCIPMLPESLSNGLCSLKPDVARLAVSILMKFAPDGELLHHKIVRSAIINKRRFSYQEAFEIIEGREKSPYKDQLDLMVKLALILKKQRFLRGSIDFSLPEAKIVVDKQGNPLRIDLIEYDISHQLVEEYMLKANELVAKHLSKKDKKLIYRIHDEPKEENFEDFFSLARTLGFHLPQKPENSDIQKLFQEAKGSPHFHRLSVSFIRSMKLAMYSPENVGHYGLRLEHYTHFTSPIRRYADLIIHRLLFNLSPDDLNVDKIAVDISDCERKSMKAEGSVIQLKKLRLMKKEYEKDPGKIYHASITKVKPFAIFFEVIDFFVEGSAHVSEIGDDYYNFDPKTSKMRGERTGQSFAFGDTLEVTIAEIDLIYKEAKFSLVTGEPKQKRKRKRKKKKS